MSMSMLERRQDPRLPAYVPIALKLNDEDAHMPAHLVDLSNGGAGILTTQLNAPTIGQRLLLQFEQPSHNGQPAQTREELAVVVNLRQHDREIARAGVRFLHTDDSDNIFQSGPVLSTHRKSLPNDVLGIRHNNLDFPRKPQKISPSAKPPA